MKKHLQYLKYVMRHKYYVLVAGIQVEASLWRLIKHDWSKFLPVEWFAYVNYFYDKEYKVGDKIFVVVDNAGIEVEIVERESMGNGEFRTRVRELARPQVEFALYSDKEISHKLGYPEAFREAWNHHQKMNDHHWQYWLLINDDYVPGMKGITATHRKDVRVINGSDCLRMSPAAVREMVADWCGAGKAITGEWQVVEWYEKNKNKILLHHETRAFVEKLIRDTQQRLREKYNG